MVSDEFEGHAFDIDKWFVLDDEEQFYKWHGRAPSKFAPHNVRIENGKLKLHTQWEPNHDFSTHQFGSRDYGNLTTAVW